MHALVLHGNIDNNNELLICVDKHYTFSSINLLIIEYAEDWWSGAEGVEGGDGAAGSSNDDLSPERESADVDRGYYTQYLTLTDSLTDAFFKMFENGSDVLK